MEEIKIKTGKKIYFASDFHLGAPDEKLTGKREKIICSWLNQIKNDAQVIFLVGDLFDFWFEHHRVAPKGYSRFMGKLAELSDAGVRLIIFQGNHDMWMLDYFEREFGAEVYREPKEYNINNKTFYIGHGDGLGPGDYFYKGLKVVFESKISRWLFRSLLHPDLALWLGNSWAKHSWYKEDKVPMKRKPLILENEILYHYCLEMESMKHHDYYIFGHRHLKLDIELSKISRYINLGDWISFYSYAVFDGTEIKVIDYFNQDQTEG